MRLKVIVNRRLHKFLVVRLNRHAVSTFVRKPITAFMNEIIVHDLKFKDG